MQNLTRKLLTEWRKLKLPFRNKNIIIAVSGGADSCALSYAIYDLVQRSKFQNTFIIAHFNHNLRGTESDRDYDFVKNYADQLNFDFIGEIAKKGVINANTNIEQSARIARYDFLQRSAQRIDAFAVLTAHTMDDQAETCLLNMLRGSGTNGLAAMKNIRKISENNDTLLVRPFLNSARRKDIKEFVKKNDILFREDSMNHDVRFKRVKIRKELLHQLKSFNPNIVETLVNTSKLIEYENELVSEFLVNHKPFNELTNCDQLKVSELKSLSNAMVYKIIREWLKNKKGNLRSVEFKHVESIRKLINSRKSGKIVELPNFERVEKDSGKLIFQDAQVEK